MVRRGVGNKEGGKGRQPVLLGLPSSQRPTCKVLDSTHSRSRTVQSVEQARARSYSPHIISQKKGLSMIFLPCHHITTHPLSNFEARLTSKSMSYYILNIYFCFYEGHQGMKGLLILQPRSPNVHCLSKRTRRFLLWCDQDFSNHIDNCDSLSNI